MGKEYPNIRCAGCGINLATQCRVCPNCGRKREETSFSQHGVKQKNCASCGAAMAMNAAFCTCCGAKATTGVRFCSSCGSSLEGASVFCPTCGHKIQ